MTELTSHDCEPRVPGAVTHVAGTRALVVDDDPDQRHFARHILDHIGGYSCAEAIDGADAMTSLERQPADIVLTDLRMPRMDGLALVEAIRGRYPEIPVVLMTAYGSEDIAMQALRRGAAHYVTKERLARDLKETLAQVMSVAATERKRRQVLSGLVRRESHYAIESDPALITPLITLLQEDLGTLNLWDETVRMRVGVALEEALRNALYHGNLEVDSSLREGDERAFFALVNERAADPPFRMRRIDVIAAYDRVQASYTIRDEGVGFDTSIIDKPIDPESLFAASGRGLLLMRTFMDELRFNALGNEVTMIKYRCPSRGPAPNAPGS